MRTRTEASPASGFKVNVGFRYTGTCEQEERMISMLDIIVRTRHGGVHVC